VAEETDLRRDADAEADIDAVIKEADGRELIKLSRKASKLAAAAIARSEALTIMRVDACRLTRSARLRASRAFSRMPVALRQQGAATHESRESCKLTD
jgi:hypothetical protein